MPGLSPHPAGFLAFILRQLFLTPTPAPASTNLTGEVGIITGSNTGLGFEAARQVLALNLSTLIIAVRSPAKGETAKSQLSQEFPEANIQVWQLNMNSYDSIRTFAARAATLPRLDFAMLNAGVAKNSFQINKGTGHEETFQVNYLSTAALSLLLIPVLRGKRPATHKRPGKLAIVGSETGYWSPFAERHASPIFPQFDVEAKWEATERYQVTKLLLDFFVTRVASLVDAHDVTINISNPGLCYGSEIHREIEGVLDFVMSTAKRALGRSCAVGARALVKAAVVAGPEGHGKYYDANDVDIYPDLLSSPEGPALSEKLWKELQSELDFIDFEKVLAK